EHATPRGAACALASVLPVNPVPKGAVNNAEDEDPQRRKEAHAAHGLWQGQAWKGRQEPHDDRQEQAPPAPPAQERHGPRQQREEREAPSRVWRELSHAARKTW